MSTQTHGDDLKTNDTKDQAQKQRATADTSTTDAARVRQSGFFVEMRECRYPGGRQVYEIELCIGGARLIAFGDTAIQAEQHAARIIRSRCRLGRPEPYCADVHGDAHPGEWQGGHR